MDLDRSIYDRARRSRDARFDGRFFIGVTTTGVYCRPICPARSAKDEHVRYFPTAAAAEAAGFRPCLRCRPEASPGTPAWFGTSGIVSRALRLISDGALDEKGVDELAGRLGVTARHLRRLFLQHLGATPLEVALTRRVHFAKKLLDETTLALSQVAFASGFGSLRRFNAQIRRTYARTPTELRRLAHRDAARHPDCYRFRLAYRPPYDWDAMLTFLGARATPGVESVTGVRYRRTVTVGGEHGFIEVTRPASGSVLDLDVRFPNPQALLFIVERVRRIFDLGADPAIIDEHLGADPLLRGILAKHPGLRTPGAWDGFELAVRAILGQQISVAAATTIAGRLASFFGSAVVDGGGLNRLFPTPAQLANAPVERAGVVRARAEAIRTLARRVADGSIAFSSPIDGRTTMSALRTLPGIGDWTSAYIAMRALGEPDAFPSGDLVLRRLTGDATAGDLNRRSEAWRPWRAYAVILLWQEATDEAGRIRHAKPDDRVDPGDRPGRSAPVVALLPARG
jgi:AraC family transcriptional regulator of adaptative response / DNA-3-methyladenine glycosylase II